MPRQPCAVPDPLDHARRLIADARSVVVLTGAGISAESGIPTFRGGMDALWKDFDPATLATPEAFARDPATVSRWYDWRRQKCREAIPNPGHLALAALERALEARAGRFTLLTQNVDRLHHRAGSSNVVELHGTIMHWRCSASGREIELPDGPLPTYPFPSPHCAGSLARPDVVWFGEPLPSAAVHAAQGAVADCDLFISIGTSSVVYPAAAFIHEAAAHGAATIEINRDATPISSVVDVSIRGRAGEVLPQILNPVPN